MAISTNLGITLLEVAQDDKEAAINTAINNLDTCLSARLVHNMVSDADYTIDTGIEEHYNLIIEITDTGPVLSTSRNIILPNTTQAHIIKNSTLQTLVFKTLAGTGVSIIPSAIELVYSNGSNIEAISSLSSTGIQHHLHMFYPGLPEISANMSYLVHLSTVYYASGLPESYCKALVAATGSTTFSMQKNGVQFGTFNFAGGATTATFTMASSTTFNAGDTFKVVAPAGQDATLADISLNLKGLRF